MNLTLMNSLLVKDINVVMFMNFEKLDTLSINIFEVRLYQEGVIGKHNLVSIEISKNDNSDRVVDLMLYKNHYVLIDKL